MEGNHHVSLGSGGLKSHRRSHVRRSTCGERDCFYGDGGHDEIMRRTCKSRLAFGAGRNASWKKGSRVCFALDRVLMAKASGLSVSSVNGSGAAMVSTHRVRQFKLSNDPRFVDKLRDVVGLYVDPPAHAIVLSLDERAKSRRLTAQPGLPLKKGRAGDHTQRHGRHARRHVRTADGRTAAPRLRVTPSRHREAARAKDDPGDRRQYATHKHPRSAMARPPSPLTHSRPLRQANAVEGRDLTKRR